MFGFVPAEMLVTTAKALLEHDPKTLALELKKVYDEGVEPAQFLKDLRSALEVVYLQKLGVGTDSDPVWTSVVAAATPEALGFLLRRINRALEELRFGDSPRLALELGLFSAIEAAHDLSAWVSRLEALEKRLSAGGGGPSLSRIAPAVIIPETKTQPSAVNPPAAPKAGALWEQFIEAVSREKISLGAALHSCSQSLNSNGGWVIRFNKPFDLEAAERSREFLEKTLVALGGPDRRMEFSLAQTAPVVMTDIIDPAIAPTPGGDPPGAHWKDVTDIPKNVSGLKEAEGVFGGKARIVKSRPKSA
jgi:DNA polymerase III gamma/tau subunit